MESTDALKGLLQLQLGSDSSAVLHLPYVLASLSHECLLPSSHLPKWTSRINSLLHSKDPGGRWAGLSLALKTSTLSKTIMMEFAQSWLGVALPMLSKNEPLPNLKAAVRLLKYIFSAAVDVPEFQRQVATPNVPKFSLTLVTLAEKALNIEFKILLLSTLTHLIPIYPTLHRGAHASISALALKFLNGMAPNPTGQDILNVASRLYSVLHFTGGKVGAANLWKASVDETLSLTWTAFLGLRTTFPYGEHISTETSSGDPLIGIPLNLDRLRSSIIVLCDLIRTTSHRPVQVPIGSFVSLINALICCTTDEKIDGHVDPVVRSMEIAVTPAIWKLGCDLVICLGQCVRYHLAPHVTQIVAYIAFHLEQDLTSLQRLPFLKALQILLSGYPLPSQLSARLGRAVLPFLTIVLATQTTSQQADITPINAAKSRKGKKRGRGYEGDELFKTSREVICPRAEDGEVVVAALHVMRILLSNSSMPPAVHSIASRVLLAMLLALPQIPPWSLSSNLALHGALVSELQTLTADLGSGTTSIMSKSLGVVLGAVDTNSNNSALTSNVDARRTFDLLLHPRLPPLVRSLPHVESLSLFRAEESHEEIAARQTLRLEVAHSSQIPASQDTAIVKLGDDMVVEGQMREELALPPSHHTSNHTVARFAHVAEAIPKPLLAPTTNMNNINNPPAYALPPSPLEPRPTSAITRGPLDTPATPTNPVEQLHMVTHEEGDDEDIPLIDMDSDSD